MDSGFGTNLEGFLIKGNLSIFPGCQPDINGDGSLEASGTFYIGNIQEYNLNQGINIQNVIFGKNYVKIPYNTPSSIGTTTGCLLLNGGITINNTTDSTSVSNGGTITTLGGISIGKTLNVGGNINVNTNKIINLDWPTNPLDAANKAYVDAHVSNSIINGSFGNMEILIGSSGNIISSPNFIYNTSGQLIINTTNTTNSVIITDGSVDINGNLDVGVINVNNNYIHNVNTPVLPLDAVNKEYVDNIYEDLLGIITSGNVSSNGIYNVYPGEIVLGSNTIGNIEGCSTIYYTSGSLYITNTTNSIIGLNSGGSLIISGGVSINDNVFIGGIVDMGLNRIENVDFPLLGYDAVNKDYLQALIQSIPTNEYIMKNYNYQNTLVLNNNQSIPTNIPLLSIDAIDTLSFIAIIYINCKNINNESVYSTLYTIYGYYTGSKWIYNSNYTGENSCIVNFYVENTLGSTIANIYYTNLDSNNITTIEYYIDENIQVLSNTNQYNYSIISSNNIYIDFLSYISSNIVSVKIYSYISINNDASIYIFDLLYNQYTNKWIMNYERIGNDLEINFKLTNLQNENNTCSIGSIQYNSINTATIRVIEYKVLTDITDILLLNNVSNNTIIESTGLISTQYTQLFIYVERINQGYAFYTINAYNFNNQWYTNIKFIGDYLKITFNINSDNILEYSNPDDTYTTFIKILYNNPTIFTPLSVPEGGTGNTYLEPYSVLLGNGYNPIINTTDLTYIDSTLNIQGDISLTGNANIGELLYVNNINITPSIGDLNENIFYANNNQIIANNITNFKFESLLVKSFIAQISITILTNVVEYDSLITLKGINSNGIWYTNSDFIGTNITGFINLLIDDTGQINYTSTNINGWISTKIRFRASTTTI